MTKGDEEDFFFTMMTSQSQVLKGQQREVKRGQLKSSEGVLVTDTVWA